MIKLASLEDVIQYKNPAVVFRFKDNHPKDAHRAEQLFTEMLRYLWLCVKHTLDTENNPGKPELNFIPVMHEEMRAMDNMWHEFILLTRDYHDFCQDYFGQFIHHEPNMRQKVAYSESQFVESLNLFLNYIYDVLGEDVLKIWFQDYLENAA